ncbi:MAG: YfhO family protein [Acidimicrobiaceae bacterium]|nr:YfhO family protein [Acidimicrobiaceae bacterium]
MILWGGVLVGKRVMAGGDILYGFPPWSGALGHHSIHNRWVYDGVTQFLPWLAFTRRSLAAGHLPLWDPYALFGAPLLANGQAAPFSPFTVFAVAIGGTLGMSLAMLAKLWVAGTGTFVYLRRLGVGGMGRVLGGLAFATSSFMIVWLYGQNSSVAALLPWAFAALEWYIQAPRARRLAVLALIIGLQFLAGQPDASLYLCLGVALYGTVRCARSRHRAALPGLVIGGLVGVLVASVQLVPFAALLRESGTVGVRAAEHLGIGHLPFSDLDSWLVPNLLGNPAIDGAQARLPNYTDATGFAGVTALALAVPGLVVQWKRDRPTSIALAVVGFVGVATVYGALTPALGRLPGFASVPSERMLMLPCFVVACLGGIGLDGLARRPVRVGLNPRGLVASAVGFGALGVVLVAAVLFGLRGSGVDSLGPVLHQGWVTFWVAFAAACLVGAVGLATAAWFGMPRRAVSGLALLALVEAAVFAGPYQPRLPASEVPPHSAAMDWLVAHAGERTIAADSYAVPPETAALYGLHDARGYEQETSPRVAIFWSHADPDYAPPLPTIELNRPGARWLAAAGVRYFVTRGPTYLPGTVPVYRGEGVTISRVPHARRFAFAAPSIRWVSSPQQAARGMAADPLGAVRLEGSGPRAGGRATVAVVSRQPGKVELDVNAVRAAEIVVLQSYAPGWDATVDGRPTPIVPADVLFQAVRVPAGRHHVSLLYRPSSVALGLGLSVAGLLLVVLLLLMDPDLSGFRRSMRNLKERHPPRAILSRVSRAVLRSRVVRDGP